MGIAGIIELIVSTGIKVVPQIVSFIESLHKNTPPTQADIDAAWADHKKAYAEILGEDAETHPE